MMITYWFFQPMLKAELGWNISALQICYVYALLDWLQIMYQLVNIGLGFSLKNLLHVCAVITLLRQRGMFFLSVYGIKSLGIQRENPLKIFSLS